MMAKKDKTNYIWDGIDEEDFRSESLINDCEVGDYNKSGMVIFQANINYARQLARAEDSLKPIERRTLYICYSLGAVPGHNIKAAKITGALIAIHNHNEQAAYKSIINLAQYWKKNVPLISGNCNLGSIDSPKTYAASRYAELMLSKYAYECFFEDYDAKAVNTNEFLVGDEEPEILPSKFPNILVNGNSGIGNGFATYMPPFNVYDIVEVTTKLIKNPDIPVEELVIAPDFPTECDIIENESDIEQYCVTGKGNVTVRGHIDIEDHGNSWLLIVRSLPYGISFPSVKEKVLALGKSGAVNIKAVHEESKAYITSDGDTRKIFYFDVEIPKSLDPIKVQRMLYKNCDLEKTIALQSTVVVDDGKTTIKTLNMKELLQYWIDARRMYKRSLFNHKINKTLADIDIDKAMIFMLEGTNLEKTVSIIRNSNTSTVVDNLLKAYGKAANINSYQAKVIASKPLSAFTKDAAERYKDEIIKLEESLEKLTSIAYSAEKIDNIIISELNDLKKYGTPQRKSALITVDGEKEFADTDHRIIFTKNGHIKKLPLEVDAYHTKTPYGAFEQGDTLYQVVEANNTDGLLLFNDRGRFSIIPVTDINNNVYNEYGDTVFNVTKLDGKLVSVYVISGKDFRAKKKKSTFGTDSYVISLTKKGFMKKTRLSEYVLKDNKKMITSLRNSLASSTKGADDNLVCDVRIVPEAFMNGEYCNLMVYTKMGEYVLLNGCNDIAEFGKNATGLAIMNPSNGEDSCAGFSFILISEVKGFHTHALVTTKNGCMKRVELQYLAKSKKRKDSASLATIANDDEIVSVLGCCDGDIITVVTKSGTKELAASDVPVLARKSLPKKMIPLVGNDEVSFVELNVPVKKK